MLPNLAKFIKILPNFLVSKISRNKEGWAEFNVEFADIRCFQKNGAELFYNYGRRSIFFIFNEAINGVF